MKVKTYILLLLLALFSGCKLSDIYTEPQKKQANIDGNQIIEKSIVTYGDEEKWKKVKRASAILEDEWPELGLIQKSVKNYGGRKKWEDIQHVTAIMEDEWPTFHWRLLANPWKERTTRLKFDWQINSNNSRIEILTGKKKGKVYGVHNGMTYAIKDSLAVYRKNKDILFHLPTMKYFFEFPFRIKEADIIHYGGRKKIEGIVYETILMSWNTLEPQKKIDQYLIYINAETHFIDYLEFTVREQGKFAYATVHFEDFRNVGAFIFPHKVTAYFQNRVPGKTVGHQMRIDNFILNENLTDDYFVPATVEPRTK